MSKGIDDGIALGSGARVYNPVSRTPNDAGGVSTSESPSTRSPGPATIEMFEQPCPLAEDGKECPWRLQY